MGSSPLTPGRPAQPIRRRLRVIYVLVALVIVVSAGVRFADLGRFPERVWDEHYYAHDAVALLHGQLAPRGPTLWRPGVAIGDAHPELGVELIAAGIAVFGDHPLGWRVAAAIAGTLLIALVFPIARRLSLPPEWALAATVLAATDSLLIVQSRLAMLDIFVALWSALCIYCALRALKSALPWRWTVLCGLAGGAATATKWSGGLAVIAALLLLALMGRTNWKRFGQQAALIAAVVLVVYVVAYAPYFLAGHTIPQWLRLQRYMVAHDWKSRGTLSDTSRPLTWPFDVGAIWYHWSESSAGVSAMIALGNPLLWWSAVVAFVALAARSVKARDIRVGVFPALVAVLYAPWLVTSRPSYIFYMTPVVPFLAILVAAGLREAVGRRRAPCVPQALAFAGLALAIAGALGVAGLGETVGASLPAALVRGAAAAAGVALAAAAVALAYRARHRRPALRATLAWGWIGASAGMTLVWMPFLLGYPVLWQYYERAMWLPTWK
jgi:dolichyl-phosphate-mannose-protein mannosyltransferase